MRIISDFKDYYDSAQGYGFDPSLLYVRTTETFEFESRYSAFEDCKEYMPRHLDHALAPIIEPIKRFPHSISARIRRWETKTLEIPITVKLIGFCGCIYPAIGIDGKTFYSTHKINSGLTNSYLERCGTGQNELIAALARKVTTRHGFYWRSDPLTHSTWRTAMAEVEVRRYDPVFVDLGLPIFKIEYISPNTRNCIDRIRCTLNPFLKADEFPKVKGPAEAFQEVAMYLGNQLARQPDPDSDIPDEILRDEKGFDEWSFRRHKEEDKKYKKRKRGKGEFPTA